MKPQGHGTAMLSFRFEAAHRQLQMGGKCQNLHGHSWYVVVSLCNNTAIGGVNEDTGLSIDFSHAKGIIKSWLDEFFDHAALLSCRDHLAAFLIEEGSKVFLFGGNEVFNTRGQGTHIVEEGRYYDELPWPSVEAVAFCLGKVLQHQLTEIMGSYVTVESVMVSETETNTFAWHAAEEVPNIPRMAMRGPGMPPASEPCG